MPEPSAFCKIPHGTIRGLAAHPRLNDEARVMLAILSFTHEFYARSGGVKAIKFRELVERSGIRNHGNLQRIINRLADREVIRVQGTGRQTRVYSFIPIAEQDLSVNSAEQDFAEKTNKESPNGEQPRSSNGQAHTKKEQALNKPEEGNGAGQVDQGNDEAQLPSWHQIRLNELLAEKARCDREGTIFPLRLGVQLSELAELMALAS
jgi:hypothetical protein